MSITHVAPTGLVDGVEWTAAHTGNSLSYYNVKDYGAVGNGSADDTTALQSALDAAWNAPGGTMYLPTGIYKVTGVITPTSTDSGEVRILGDGRARSFSGGTDGDPTAAQGAVIRTTSTTADVLKFAPANTKRQLITIANLTIEGNAAGTTGNGIHFLAPSGSAILPDLRDVTIINAKENGLYFNGAAFEATIIGGRINSNGGVGFKAVTNSGGIPGEVRMYGTCFNLNGSNVEISGGGNFNFYGITSSYSDKSIVADGVGLTIDGWQFEAVGQSSPTGTKCKFSNLRSARLGGFIGGSDSGDTGIGLEFASCNAVSVRYYYAESTSAGGGYRDFSFATSTRCTMEGYMNNDDVDRFALGTGGGNAVRRGNEWLSQQLHAVQEFSSAVDGTEDPNLILYDTFVSKRTASGKTRNIRFPTNWNDNYRKGHRVTIIIHNASAGATTTTWDGFWGLAGAWTDPGAGKMRTVTFESTANGYVETGRSAADITPAF